MKLIISLLLLFPVFSIPVSPQTPQDDDVIRVESDITNLFFVATDKDKRYITTLRREDIRLREDGVAQQILTFQHETDRPLSIAFLIDVSASEERTLSLEKAAARTFIESVIRSNKDQAAIVPFTGAAFLEQPMTRDVLSIYRALERVDVALPSYTGIGQPISGIVSGPGTKAPPGEGSTAIWNAIALTATQILAPSTGQRRRAIILLTDGFDTSSTVAMNTAINQALASETIIYAIGIGDRRYEGVDEGVLRDLAERSGGRAFFPKKNADLTAAFEAIQQELRSQYLLAFTSTNKQRDGKFRQLQIEISNPELIKQQLVLRYRPGYVAKPY